MSTTTVRAELRREGFGPSRILEAIANRDVLVVSAFAVIGLLLTLCLGAVPLD
jgi:hypothetical protein